MMEPPGQDRSSPIDLEQVVADLNRAVSDDRFWATRGKAVQAYARLEQALCRVFALVSDTSAQVAAIIFFKIQSAQARDDVLDKLIRLRFGRKFNLFWNSIFKAIKPITNTRNEIVHWGALPRAKISADGLLPPEIVLRPPTFWSSFDDSAPQISNDGLLQFIKQCDFYSKHINIFADLNGSHIRIYAISSGEEQPWLDIFRKPLVYPPLADTPPEPTALIRGIRPQSSPP